MHYKMQMQSIFFFSILKYLVSHVKKQETRNLHKSIISGEPAKLFHDIFIRFCVIWIKKYSVYKPV
jgi:hypothetical protein